MLIGEHIYLNISEASVIKIILKCV